VGNVSQMLYDLMLVTYC